jgi:hypothetical protein
MLLSVLRPGIGFGTDFFRFRPLLTGVAVGWKRNQQVLSGAGFRIQRAVLSCG